MITPKRFLGTLFLALSFLLVNLQASFAAAPASSVVAQPDQATYAISNLYTVQTYTSRDAYLAAKGVQAPAYDPSSPIKTWEGSGSFTVFDAASPDRVSPLIVPDAAAGVNLPGAYKYPDLVVAPTSARIVGPFGDIGAGSPDNLCLLADANTLEKELEPVFPGVKGTVSELVPMYHYVYPDLSELRRQYVVNFGSFTAIAQQLIEIQTKGGVGSPGYWSSDGKGHVNWVVKQQVTTPPAGAVTLGVPIRALLANEEFAQIQSTASPLSPWVWMVRRTDKEQPVSPVITPSTDVSALKAEMDQILVLLQFLISKLGVQ